MKLIEALESLKHNPPAESPALSVQLACGFTPLHFLTFLGAHLRGAFPQHRVSIATGSFGDLPGNLERLSKLQDANIVAVIEWPDLDPRLGIRVLGGWNPGQLTEFAQTARDHAGRILAAVETIAKSNILVVTLPTLPIPPVSYAPGWYASRLESELNLVYADLSIKLSALPNVRIVSKQKLDLISPLAERFDAKAELNTGFPYSLTHADKLAGLIAKLISNPQAKKGLITDLDNTLWLGILGEVNPEGISWDLDHHSQKHGIYQQLLASLAESGILIGVASKNDPALVEEGFRTRQPFLSRERIFPLEANWGPKSESVRKIIDAWNIGADSVVFVDDSPLELAEVKAAHPGIECVLFPKDDDKAAYELLYQLRDTFGKTSLSAEDAIRMDSIRSSHAIAEARRGEGYTPERFLQEAGGKLALSFTKDPPDPRALELINKTNQFNTTGRRWKREELQALLADGGRIFAFEVADNFTAYGLVGVVVVQSRAVVQWVMSCRVLGYQIEQAVMAALIDMMNAEDGPESGGSVTGTLIETDVNFPCRSLFSSCGFVQDGQTWRLPGDTHVSIPDHIVMTIS